MERDTTGNICTSNPLKQNYQLVKNQEKNGKSHVQSCWEHGLVGIRAGVRGNAILSQKGQEATAFDRKFICHGILLDIEIILKI